MNDETTGYPQGYGKLQQVMKRWQSTRIYLVSIPYRITIQDLDVTPTFSARLVDLDHGILSHWPITANTLTQRKERSGFPLCIFYKNGIKLF